VPLRLVGSEMCIRDRSIASVSIAHLVKAAPAGFVRELIYAGGGSYLILALASLFVFLKG
jgi:hypothetical protein